MCFDEHEHSARAFFMQKVFKTKLFANFVFNI